MEAAMSDEYPDTTLGWHARRIDALKDIFGVLETKTRHAHGDEFNFHWNDDDIDPWNMDLQDNVKFACIHRIEAEDQILTMFRDHDDDGLRENFVLVTLVALASDKWSATGIYRGGAGGPHRWERVLYRGDVDAMWQWIITHGLQLYQAFLDEQT
jgi:hypothetical protein